MGLKFSGLFEPWEIPTGDRRMFKAEGLRNRKPPLPVMMRTSSGGHEGAETVAMITSIESTPAGRRYHGEFLDPAMVPQVRKAVYLAKKGLLRPSLDLDRSYTVEPRDHTDGKKVAYFTDGNVIGATLVPMPAFDEVTFELHDDEDEDTKALVASIMAEFAAGGSTWDQLPIAPRDYTYDADDAVKRIAAWAGIGTPNADTNRYASMFLWRGGNQTGDSLAQQDFRMPIGDVVNGQPYLVFHAIYAAAALLSGAHGGLPNVPEGDKQQIRGVINQIYPKMAKHFQDPQMHSPFTGEGQHMSTDAEGFFEEDEPIADVVAAFNAAEKQVTQPYGDVTYADPGYRDNKKRYPIDTAEHVRAAWSYINQEQNAAEYDAEQLKSIRERIMAAAKKFGVQITASDDGFALSPPVADHGEFAIGGSAPSRAAFADPGLKRATPLTVEGNRVFGHLGKWGECHLGIGDRCVMLPKSRTEYSLFKTGTVILDSGEPIRVGKITVGTGHAHPHYGIVPSRDHYDNSGWCAAVVNIGEDQFGVWVAGVLTDPGKADELRRSPLSGDWRRYNGNLELVAALAVNNPGFPVFHMEESEEFSLVAAGVNWRMTGGSTDRDVTVEPPSSFSIEPDAGAAQRARRLRSLQILNEQRAQEKRAARLRQRMGEFADMGAPAPMPAPNAPVQAPAPAGQQGDVNVDPGADPASPDIAELDDPGRESLLARMANSYYMIEDEDTGQEVQPGAFLYGEAQESAKPKAQDDAQVAAQAGQQAVQQTQAAQAPAPPAQPAPAATPPQG